MRGYYYITIDGTDIGMIFISWYAAATYYEKFPESFKRQCKVEICAKQIRKAA